WLLVPQTFTTQNHRRTRYTKNDQREDRRTGRPQGDS
ncbi:uncharacterized protein METZ01_LOCUS192210, partial [marine metagenome]